MAKVGLDDYLMKHGIDEFQGLPVEPIKQPSPVLDSIQPIILHPALDVRERFALFGLRHQRVTGEEVKESVIFFVATLSGIGFTNKALVDFGDSSGVFNLQGKLLPLAGDRIDLDNMVLWLKNPISPDVHELYASIKNKLRLYLHLPEPAYGLVAAWVIGTYFYCAFSAYPFLHFLGPKETGKTNVLIIMSKLSFNAARTTYISAPALADTTDALRGTFLLDQADNLDRNPKLLSILTDSYKRDGGRRRVVTLTKTARRVVEFDSYSPKAFASKSILPEDLADRCFTINMAPAPHPYPDPGSSDEDWRAIRTSLYQLLLTNYSTVHNLILNETKEPSRFGELWLPVSTLLSLVKEEATASKEIRDYCAEKFNLVRFELDDWHRALVDVVIDAPREIMNKQLLAMLITNIDPKDGEARPGETWLGKEVRALGLLNRSTRQHGGQLYLLNKEHALEYVASETTYTTCTSGTEQLVQDIVHPDIGVQDEPAHEEHPAPPPTLPELDAGVQDDSSFQNPPSATNRRETILGMTIEEALETWQAAGAPVIHLGPGETCLDLEELLSLPDVHERHLEAVRQWLEKVMA